MAETTGQEQLYQAVFTHLAAAFQPEELTAAGTLDNAGTGQTAGRRVEIEIGQLDPRQTIAACGTELQTSMNQQQQPLGRLTVRVECNDEAPWSRYIPAHVKIYEPVLVAGRTLERGRIISAEDLSHEIVEISTLLGNWLRDPEQVIGKEARRTITAGSPLSADRLSKPELVKRGDTVVIIARKGQIMIRHQGTAMEAGELGKQINVRNNSSQRVIQVRVSGYGETEAVF
ncbi:MAG: flagellar basal body P-ring formation chaperone FlgA [Pseudomonadales bacterium]|nr:flagellar basal body P-ring formation chaperone FlgA [Pseudomonadales bacterium]